MNIKNQKSILKSILDSKLEQFFLDIEVELKETVTKANNQFDSLVADLNRLSIKLGRFNKTNYKTFKSSLLEKIIDSKIEAIKEIKKSYPEQTIIDYCFDNLYSYTLEDAFLESNPLSLMNDHVLSDIDVDLESAKCDCDTYDRISELYDIITEVKQREVA